MYIQDFSPLMGYSDPFGKNVETRTRPLPKLAGFFLCCGLFGFRGGDRAHLLVLDLE
jgi:hypothetical protein